MNAKPREVKQLQGTLRKHRDNDDAPKPGQPVGRSPIRLLESEKRIFDALKRNLLPKGVAKRTDAIAVSMMARLLAKFEDDSIGAVELNALLSLMGRFGMTPVDRQRVVTDHSPKAKEANPFAEFTVVDGGKK